MMGMEVMGKCHLYILLVYFIVCQVYPPATDDEVMLPCRVSVKPIVREEVKWLWVRWRTLLAVRARQPPVFIPRVDQLTQPTVLLAIHPTAGLELCGRPLL